MLRIIFFTILSILTLILSSKAINLYSGNFTIYILFTLLSTGMVFYSFRKNAIFFDTFIAVFLWLGFWLKITYTIIYLKSNFKEGLDGIIISGDIFDKSLVVSGIAFLSLMFASYLRERFIFTYTREKDDSNFSNGGLFFFYKSHRIKVIILYILLFLFVGISNFYLGIYQRGELTQTYLPFGLNGIYKWLLLFGLSSFAALILRYEFALQKRTVFFVPILTLIEAAVTNISLLSRGMILNISALGYGMLHYLRKIKIKIDLKFLIITILSVYLLYALSMNLVNNIRDNSMYNKDNSILNNSISTQTIEGPMGMLLIRGVGSEGIIAVTNNPNKGWDLFYKALSEKTGEYVTSFYDTNIIQSPYKDKDMSAHHYVSLPGFIAFFYYSGSVIFVFFMVFLLGIFASLLEYLAYKSDRNNLILAALIAQVIAYRYTHFGYAPGQSYLLFGAIILNILIIYGLNKLFNRVYKKHIINEKL